MSLHGCENQSFNISSISRFNSLSFSSLALINNVTASSHALFIGSLSNLRPATALKIMSFLEVTVALVLVVRLSVMIISLTVVSHSMFKYFVLRLFKFCVISIIPFNVFEKKHKVFKTLNYNYFTHKHKNTGGFYSDQCG